jgi:hypothetical protein
MEAAVALATTTISSFRPAGPYFRRAPTPLYLGSEKGRGAGEAMPGPDPQGRHETENNEGPASLPSTDREAALRVRGLWAWALAVTSLEEMPPRLDPWYAELAASTLILKIPREVDRLDAKAGDNLYRNLLRVGGEPRRREARFGQIAAAASRELVLVVRGSAKPRVAGGLGFRYESIFLPFSSLQGSVLEAREAPNGARLHILRVFASGQVHELLFDHEPELSLPA